MLSLFTPKILTIAGFSFISMIAASFYVFSNDTPQEVTRMECGENNIAMVNFGSNKQPVNAQIADDPDERRVGLMYREELGEGEGMFFIFPQAVNNGFWMKNTKIPLDMIFINHNFIVVAINKDAMPCKQGEECPTYLPPTSYRYVLEVDAGFSDLNDISEGDLVDVEFSESDCELT